MIRGVYILGEQGNMIYSKDYAKSESKSNMVEFLVNLTQFLNSVDLEDKTEYMNVAISRMLKEIHSPS